MIEQTDLDGKIRALLDYELNKYIKVKGTVVKIDRNQIYTTVSDQLGVHKAMIRKVARRLMAEYIEKINILNEKVKHNL